MINNDISVDNFSETIPNMNDPNDSSGGGNIVYSGTGSHSLTRPSSLGQNYTQPNIPALPPTFTSSASYESRQLIAVPDNNQLSASNNGFEGGFGNSQGVSEQSLELLQPILPSSERF